MADGTIRINTRLDNAQAVKDLAELKKEAQRVTRQIGQLDAKQARLGTRRNVLVQQLDEAKHAATEARKALEAAGDAYNSKFYRVRSDLAKTDKYRAMTPEQQYAAVERATKQQFPETVRQYTASEKAATAAEAQVQKLSAALDVCAAESAQLASQQSTLRTQLDAITATASNAEGRLSGLLDGMGERASRMLGFVSAVGRGGARAFARAANALSALVRKLTIGSVAARTFKSRLREILTGALFFNLLSRAITVSVQTIGAALQSNAALAQALANLKGAAYQAAAPLVDMLTPALTAMANAAAVALHYLAQLMSFFSGRSMSATKAAAKNIAAVGASAGKAGKSLAKFDEINQLSSGGGASGQAVAPNFEFSAENPFLAALNKAIEGGDWAGAGQLVADKLNTLVDNWDAQGWGRRFGQKLQNGVSFLWTALSGTDWTGLGERVAWWINGALGAVDSRQIGSLIAAKFSVGLQLMGSIIGEVGPRQMADTVVGLIAGFASALADAIAAVDFAQLGRNIVLFISSIDVAEVAGALGTLLANAIKAAFDFATTAIAEPLLGFLGSMWDIFCEEFTRTLASAEEQGTFIGIAIIQGVFNGICAMLAAVGSWVLDNILAPIAAAFCEAFGIHSPSTVAFEWGVFIMQGLLLGVLSLLDRIIDAVGKIRDKFLEGFTSLKDRLASVWRGIQDVVKGGVNGVIGFINGMITAVINGINGLTSMLNGLRIDVPKGVPVIGGTSVGFSIPALAAPQIPYLAQGAVIPPNREFLAVLGDQRHGTNIEAPLSTIEEAVRNVMGTQQVNVQFAGNLAQLGRVLRPIITTENKRRGPSLVEGVY